MTMGTSKNKSSKENNIYMVKENNKYGQRRSIMSLVWYMRASFWNFGIWIAL